MRITKATKLMMTPIANINDHLGSVDRDGIVAHHELGDHGCEESGDDEPGSARYFGDERDAVGRVERPSSG